MLFALLDLLPVSLMSHVDLLSGTLIMLLSRPVGLLWMILIAELVCLCLSVILRLSSLLLLQWMPGDLTPLKSFVLPSALLLTVLAQRWWLRSLLMLLGGLVPSLVNLGLSKQSRDLLPRFLLLWDMFPCAMPFVIREHATVALLANILMIPRLLTTEGTSSQLAR
jgi:hypothetical protein